MDIFERKQKIIEFARAYGGITNSEAQSITSAHRNTITGDLSRLVEEGTFIATGEGKGTRYVLTEGLVFRPELIEKVLSSKDKQKIDSYFKNRKAKKVFFGASAEKALTANFSFSPDIMERFMKLKSDIDEKRKLLSNEERKRRKERLVIDLSWASSNIEGNTYSLLETENLIKYSETAKGKNFDEAQMILNHKQAIDFIREENAYKKLSKHNTLELHQILINNLGVNTGFREHLVTISNSNFVPCDNQFQIVSFFENILKTINDSKSALEKAIRANLLLAFLQPFSDGNKRTSRMLGNAVLISHGYLPVSFVHTSKDEYIKAVLYFYEKQDPAYFKQLFLHELNSSYRDYIG